VPEQIYQVEHVTRYVHESRVATSQHMACLQPRRVARQRVMRHELAISPMPALVTPWVDYFGNHVHHITIVSPYAELSVTSRGLVAVSPRPEPVDPDASAPWELVRDDLRFRGGAPDPRVAEFSYPSPYVTITPALEDFARASFPAGRPVIAGATDLMRRIHEEFTFLPHATTITTPVARVLELRHGVCQDFAHLQIACLRALGLAVRYVSGYLLTDPPPGQPRLIGADASHAWLSAFCPRLGWVDIDPTNNVIPDLRHVTVAWGRDYGDVSPLRGVVLGGGGHSLRVGVSVIPDESVPADRDAARMSDAG
jgi:transglutaminase-like putative cysteine protease